MSRVRLLFVALGMAFALPTSPSAAVAQTTLAGTWQSAADEQPLSAPHQEAIWGKNAKEVRTVRMVVQPSGQATVTVNRQVVDGRGRTVKGTASVERADIQLGAVEGVTAGVRVDHGVTVTLAERRYLDDSADAWTIDGLRVKVTTFTDDASRLEVRLDFPDGRGSFWEELRRVPGRRSRSATPTRSPTS